MSTFSQEVELFKKDFIFNDEEVLIKSEVPGKSYEQIIQEVVNNSLLVDSLKISFDRIQTRWAFMIGDYVSERICSVTEVIDAGKITKIELDFLSKNVESVFSKNQLEVEIKMIHGFVISDTSHVRLFMPPKSEIVIEFIPRPKPEYKLSLYGLPVPNVES